MSTQDTVPEGHFYQNISGITKIKFLDVNIDMQRLVINTIKNYIDFWAVFKQKKSLKKIGRPGWTGLRGTKALRGQ